jgi:hypothetical protein
MKNLLRFGVFGLGAIGLLALLKLVKKLLKKLGTKEVPPEAILSLLRLPAAQYSRQVALTAGEFDYVEGYKDYLGQKEKMAEMCEVLGLEPWNVDGSEENLAALNAAISEMVDEMTR